MSDNQGLGFTLNGDDLEKIVEGGTLGELFKDTCGKGVPLEVTRGGEKIETELMEAFEAFNAVAERYHLPYLLLYTSELTTIFSGEEADGSVNINVSASLEMTSGGLTSPFCPIEMRAIAEAIKKALPKKGDA